MALFAKYPLVIILILANYLLVVFSIYHLIFKTHYPLIKRLNWMVILWLVPVIGPIAYWLYWNRS
ncbi:PLDc N-terminal domain-containing protein [Pontibacter sp. MBLB2868]|uniref:PLDc N-terminal domain-containing protein n=1 Tax=Pontibacter sp. MBLB2868 TaxID=3451555 RepID=UPI003F752B7E